MYRPAVYNHMDAVIMCCDWRPDPQNILESDKNNFFCTTLHNYIITISKQDTVWLYHSKFTEVLVSRADHHGYFFQYKLPCFSGRIVTGWQTLFTYNCSIFFLSFKLPKTTPVTTLLLFGPVTLHCWTFSFIEWRICLAIRLNTIWQHTLDPCLGRCRLASDTTSRGASELQWNCPPSPHSYFHTDNDAENLHMIPALKGHCEWCF